MKSGNHTESTSNFFGLLRVWTLLAGVVLAAAGMAQAKELRPSFQKPACTGGVGGCGGGGELPSPFDTANRKVELADGEAYLLAGRVVLTQVMDFNGERKIMPYFRVDLNEHPWLASESRVNQPYYPLEGSLETWKEYVSVGKIKLPCIAHGVVRSNGSHFQYVISLQLSSELPVEPMKQ